LIDFVGNNILLKLQLCGSNKNKKIKREETKSSDTLFGPTLEKKKTRKREEKGSGPTHPKVSKLEIEEVF